MRPKSTWGRRKPASSLSPSTLLTIYSMSPITSPPPPHRQQNTSTCFRDEEAEVHRAQQIKCQARCWPATVLQALGPVFIWPSPPDTGSPRGLPGDAGIYLQLHPCLPLYCSIAVQMEATYLLTLGLSDSVSQL